MTTPWIIFFLVVTIMAVIATMAFLFELLEEPSWGNLLAVLAGLTCLAVTISILLGIGIEISKAWWLIVARLVVTALNIYLWIHRYDPNVEIMAPFDDVGGLAIVGMVWGVAMTVMGILGFFDYRFARYAENFSSAAEQLKHVIQLLFNLA